MLNFQNNIFFAKFTVLFFILTIFGYWGIDLNSEELYIAFSFFILVVVGVILSRQAILVMFVKSVNLKYFRILRDLLIIISSLRLKFGVLLGLRVSLRKLHKLLLKVVNFSANYLAKDFAVIQKILAVRKIFFFTFLNFKSSVFVKNILRVKKFYSFSGITGKFFSIKL